MSFVRYTATRSVIVASPSRQNQQFDMNLELMRLDPSRKVERREQMALGGAQETAYFRGERIWRSQTRAIARGTTKFSQMREFLDSVEGGEGFSFDPYNQVGASPDALRTVKLTSKGYPEARRVRRGDGGGGDFFTWVFTMRET